MKKICLLGIGLMIATFNAYAMESEQMMPEGPFIGINTWKDKCHVVTEDNAFLYMGDAKTKVTMNDQFVIATCQVVYPTDADVPPVNGRNEVANCHIKVEGYPGFQGQGGFTISADGIINGNCKAPR